MRLKKTYLALPAAAFSGLLFSTTADGAEGAAAAPSSTARNAVHIELGGPGLLYSVNYERFLLPELSVRGGVSLFGLRENQSGDSLGVFTVPLTAQYLAFRGSHHLELGLGMITGVLWSDLNSVQPTAPFGLVAATATIGYRYQPPEGGLIFRVAFTPFYAGDRFSPLGLPVQPWGTIGAGMAF